MYFIFILFYVLYACKVGGAKLVTAGDVVADAYGGRAIFHSLSKTQEGRYSCQAINDVGADTGYIDLRVLGEHADV